MQFKVRTQEIIHRNVMVEADSEEDAAAMVRAYEWWQMQEYRAKVYELDIAWVSLAPFTDWPYEK